MPETHQPISPRRRSRRLGGPPVRIAFVVDWLEEPYQGAVLKGAIEQAQARGANLVVIPGGILGGLRRNGAERNHLYELLSPRRYDGLVVMAGTLGNQLGEDVVGALCADFPKDRVCSVAIALRDSPSVLIDNRRGIQSAIHHLILQHNCTRIAFIRGPSANMEAEERYWAYKDALESHGLVFDERLVLDGDFLQESGALAVRTLLDERRIPISEVDAVVAADDLMILGALDELKKRAIGVPDEVALMGFDDIEEARHASPPLSSVRQPFEEQGREAVRAVLASIAGNPPTEPVRISTTDHFRRSCGCVPEDDTFFTERPPASGTLDLEAGLIRQRTLILAQMTRSARGNITGVRRGWEVRLYGALHDELKGQYGAFRKEFTLLLQLILDAEGDVSLGHALITGLRKELTIVVGDSVTKLRRVESLLHDARVITSQVIERSQAARRLRTERWARVISDVSAQLVTTFDMGRLGEAISMQLPRLGIKSCYICLYDKTQHDQAELVLGFGRWGKQTAAHDPIRFDAVDLVPPDLLSPDDQVTLVVEPLSTPNEKMGFAVLEYGDVEPYVYEVLRELLTAALIGASLATSSPSRG